MTINSIEVFAAPSMYMEGVRNEVEAAINVHNRQRERDPLNTAFLVCLQSGVNRAVKRYGVDVAPLSRRIFA